MFHKSHKYLNSQSGSENIREDRLLFGLKVGESGAKAEKFMGSLKIQSKPAHSKPHLCTERERESL